jgi:hypothetical protein
MWCGAPFRPSVHGSTGRHESRRTECHGVASRGSDRRARPAACAARSAGHVFSVCSTRMRAPNTRLQATGSPPCALGALSSCAKRSPHNPLGAAERRREVFRRPGSVGRCNAQAQRDNDLRRVKHVAERSLLEGPFARYFAVRGHGLWRHARLASQPHRSHGRFVKNIDNKHRRRLPGRDAPCRLAGCPTLTPGGFQGLPGVFCFIARLMVQREAPG